VIPIPHKLITMFRRDRPVHQVPQALRTLDRAMQIVANEQQEALTLAKARETLLANPGQPSPTGSVLVARPRPAVARKPSISPSVGLCAGAVAVALVGIVALIVWSPSVVSIISLQSFPLVIYMLVQLPRLWFPRAIHKERENEVASLWVSLILRKRASISQRTDRPHRVAE
jgi:hypothetical protein